MALLARLHRLGLVRLSDMSADGSHRTAKHDVHLPDLEAQVWCCARRAAPAAQHVDEFSAG